MVCATQGSQVFARSNSKTALCDSNARDKYINDAPATDVQEND